MSFRRNTLLGGLALTLVFAPSDLRAQDASLCWLRGETTPEQAAAKASPLKVVAITMGEETAQLCHSSPAANGRAVMGELVPFGELWRTGANEPTQFILPFDAKVGGTEVAKGHYSLYSIPGEDEWQFFLSPVYERWGIPITDEVRAVEVGFTRTAATTDEMIESLTFRWASHGEMMGHLVLEWEHTRVEIPIHHGSMGH